MIRTAIALRMGIAAILALSTTGCSAAPDTDAIREAVQNNDRFVQALEASLRLDNMFGGSGGDTFADLLFEKGECAAASGASGFVCDFRIGRVPPCADQGTDAMEDGMASSDLPACDGTVTYGNWTKARFF